MNIHIFRDYSHIVKLINNCKSDNNIVKGQISLIVDELLKHDFIRKEGKQEIIKLSNPKIILGEYMIKKFGSFEAASDMIPEVVSSFKCSYTIDDLDN